LKTVIFDLDGTVIDSSHRANILPDGSLDLADWIENNRPEKILRDSLLPMAKLWRGFIAGGATIAICTARYMQDADFQFLRVNGLFSHFTFSRPLGCLDADAGLKVQQLGDWMKREQIESAVMYDDNASVREAVSSSLPIVCIDPIGYNSRSI